MSNTPLSLYQQALTEGFVADSAQAQAVQHLQQCFDALMENQATRGVYLWGPVGRGKTWLMDSFFSCLIEQRIPAKRQHFHHFMQWLHKRLFQLTGTVNPLQHVASELAAEIRVLCFDEFYINDIGDAMLLGPLLQALFEQGLVLLATSNEAPHRLYHNGFNRDRILPALRALEAHAIVVHLDGGQDHRTHGEASIQRYWAKPTDEPSTFSELFKGLTGTSAQADEVALGSRHLNTLGQHPEALWCDYHSLCEGNWAAQDYIALCQKFKRILISAVPKLSAPEEEARIARGTEDAAARVLAGDRELAPLSKNDNGARRFIALIDECYEQQVPVYIEAEVPLIELYLEGTLLFPFQRTLSRLQAMQRVQF